MENGHREAEDATTDESGLRVSRREMRAEQVHDPITDRLRHLDRLDRAKLAVSDLRANRAILTDDQVDTVLDDIRAYLGCVSADLLEEIEILERRRDLRPVTVKPRRRLSLSMPKGPA